MQARLRLKCSLCGFFISGSEALCLGGMRQHQGLGARGQLKLGAGQCLPVQPPESLNCEQPGFGIGRFSRADGNCDGNQQKQVAQEFGWIHIRSFFEKLLLAL